jgi:hypothetical protein
MDSDFNIVCLGEIKGRRIEAHFTDEEKGQILQTIQTLAHYQPFRYEFTCYLMNTKYIQFFKIIITREVAI